MPNTPVLWKPVKRTTMPKSRSEVPLHPEFHWKTAEMNRAINTTEKIARDANTALSSERNTTTK